MKNPDTAALGRKGGKIGAGVRVPTRHGEKRVKPIRCVLRGIQAAEKRLKTSKQGILRNEDSTTYERLVNQETPEITTLVLFHQPVKQEEVNQAKLCGGSNAATFD